MSSVIKFHTLHIKCFALSYVMLKPFGILFMNVLKIIKGHTNRGVLHIPVIQGHCDSGTVEVQTL